MIKQNNQNSMYSNKLITLNPIDDNQRIGWIDFAKGIGIFLVVFAHVACPVSDEIYLFHMPLFFFLSGVLLKLNLSFLKFMKNKVRYIFVPFLIFWIISLTIRIIYLSYIGEEFSFNNFLNPNFANVTLWFFPVLFFVSIFGYFMENKIIKIVLFTLVILGVIIFGKYHFISYLERIFYCLSFFICGYLFLKHNEYVLKYWKIICFFSIIIFSIGLYLTTTSNFRLDIATVKAEGGGMSHFIVALAGIMLLIFLSAAIEKLNLFSTKIIKLLGRNSLYIFPLHWIFIQPILIFYPQSLIKDWGLSLTIVLIFFSISIGNVLKKLLPQIFR